MEIVRQGERRKYFEEGDGVERPFPDAIMIWFLWAMVIMMNNVLVLQGTSWQTSQKGLVS